MQTLIYCYCIHSGHGHIHVQFFLSYHAFIQISILSFSLIIRQLRNSSTFRIARLSQDTILYESFQVAYSVYRSIPFMTQSFTSMHKLPRGRNFYPRGFDFAFGECDYFPPLRYLYSCRCLRTVNLAVVSIRSLPAGVSRRGRQEPPSMAWACLSAHRVRFPAVHFMPGC